jgi:hypothetical protein
VAKAEGPRSHFVIPDTQTRPGVPLDHLDWIGQYIAAKKPDVIVHLGDHWDFFSLNGHEEPGSAPLEGARYSDDLFVGNEAFKRICLPIEAEEARLRRQKQKLWTPEKHFIVGNHEVRADRVAKNNPKFLGTIGSDQCDIRDWQRHEFQKPVLIDGIYYAHLFSNTGTGKPIGGEVPNRLTKINATFIQGHEQGKRSGERVTSIGHTIRGLIVGSCYLHREEYRGPHQRHWRGVLKLNEVRNGEFDLTEISLGYLCRRFEGMELQEFCNLKYPNGDWSHLA